MLPSIASIYSLLNHSNLRSFNTLGTSSWIINLGGWRSPDGDESLLSELLHGDQGNGNVYWPPPLAEPLAGLYIVPVLGPTVSRKDGPGWLRTILLLYALICTDIGSPPFTQLVASAGEINSPAAGHSLRAFFIFILPTFTGLPALLKKRRIARRELERILS